MSETLTAEHGRNGRLGNSEGKTVKGKFAAK
jgi:hypothetical protein